MISNRLKKIASFVKSNDIVADIGTDHGFVPIFLLENKIAKYVYCTDISENSLKKCIDEFNGKDIIKNAEFIVGDGLIALEEKDIDTIIIAGMGGHLIFDIINKSQVAKKSRLVLQPMQNVDILRSLLLNRGYNIIDEAIVYEDKRFFEIIVAKYDGIERTEEDYEISKILLDRRDEGLKKFLNFKIESNEELVKKLVNLNSRNEKTLDRIRKCRDNIEKYRGYYETYRDN